MRAYNLLPALAIASLLASYADAQPKDAPAIMTKDTSHLPLKRGFYVRSDIPCEHASNATLTLLQRGGMAYARSFCAFEKIAKVGPTSYRVTRRCTPLFDSASAEPETVATVTYDVPDDESFRVKGMTDDGDLSRFCPQTSLPEPWRSNDISDVKRSRE